MASAPAPSASPLARHQCYFEDVEIDVPLETPGITITAAHAGVFAGATGAVDGSAGVAPELLPLCLSSGLGWRVPRPPLVVLAFMGLEWRRLHPVRIGDTIRARSRTAAKRGMKDAGVVFEEREILNQRGEVVESCRITLLVARRPVP